MCIRLKPISYNAFSRACCLHKTSQKCSQRFWKSCLRRLMCSFWSALPTHPELVFSHGEGPVYMSDKLSRDEMNHPGITLKNPKGAGLAAMTPTFLTSLRLALFTPPQVSRHSRWRTIDNSWLLLKTSATLLRRKFRDLTSLQWPLVAFQFSRNGKANGHHQAHS